MKIAKAMKHIARTKGKIADLTYRIDKCISCDINNEFIENFDELIKERSTQIDKLIDFKNRVMMTNIKHNMFTKILRLAELKNEIDLYKNLSIKQGTHKIHYSDNISEYKTQLTISDRNIYVNKLQDAINDITDDLDIFNATTDLIV